MCNELDEEIDSRRYLRSRQGQWREDVVFGTYTAEEHYSSQVAASKIKKDGDA
jgi:hypothetical protein